MTHTCCVRVVVGVCLSLPIYLVGIELCTRLPLYLCYQLNNTLRCLFYETVHEQEGFTVTTALVSQTVRKFANCKAPGADEIHAMWLKYLPS